MCEIGGKVVPRHSVSLQWSLGFVINELRLVSINRGMESQLGETSRGNCLFLRFIWFRKSPVKNDQQLCMPMLFFDRQVNSQVQVRLKSLQRLKISRWPRKCVNYMRFLQFVNHCIRYICKIFAQS
jgi:hypothetical protein